MTMFAQDWKKFVDKAMLMELNCWLLLLLLLLWLTRVLVLARLDVRVKSQEVAKLDEHNVRHWQEYEPHLLRPVDSLEK